MVVPLPLKGKAKFILPRPFLKGEVARQGRDGEGFIKYGKVTFNKTNCVRLRTVGGAVPYIE